MPPHPHAKEKENKKEKDEKTLSLAERENSALDEDQIAFWNECKQFIGKEYSYKMVQSFFVHWGEKVKKNHKMLWQSERSWNTAFRLAAWKNKSYSVNDEVAAIRLQKAKKKQAEEMNAADQQAIAAKREEDNARLEREIAERKQGAVSYEEYLKLKAAIKREQNQACLSYAKREQARCETSIICYRCREMRNEKVLKSCSPCKKNSQTTKRPISQTTKRPISQTTKKNEK